MKKKSAGSILPSPSLSGLPRVLLAEITEFLIDYNVEWQFINLIKFSLINQYFKQIFSKDKHIKKKFLQEVVKIFPYHDTKILNPMLDLTLESSYGFATEQIVNLFNLEFVKAQSISFRRRGQDSKIFFQEVVLSPEYHAGFKDIAKVIFQCGKAYSAEMALREIQKLAQEKMQSKPVQEIFTHLYYEGSHLTPHMLLNTLYAAATNKNSASRTAQELKKLKELIFTKEVEPQNLNATNVKSVCDYLSYSIQNHDFLSIQKAFDTIKTYNKTNLQKVISVICQAAERQSSGYPRVIFSSIFLKLLCQLNFPLIADCLELMLKKAIKRSYIIATLEIVFFLNSKKKNKYKPEYCCSDLLISIFKPPIFEAKKDVNYQYLIPVLQKLGGVINSISDGNSDEGDTPLLIASNFDKPPLQTIEYLIDRGASIFSQNSVTGNNFLHNLFSNKKFFSMLKDFGNDYWIFDNILDKFLVLGGDFNSENESAWTPLMTLVQTFSKNAFDINLLISLLLKMGALKQFYGGEHEDSLLLFFLRQARVSRTNDDYKLDVLDSLVANGVDLFHVNCEGENFLHHLCLAEWSESNQQKSQIIFTLIAKLGDNKRVKFVNQRRGGEDGLTPLLIAVLGGYLGSITMLLALGANPNLAEYEGGCSALNVLAENFIENEIKNPLQIAKLLVGNNSADLKSLNNKGENAWQITKVALNKDNRNSLTPEQFDFVMWMQNKFSSTTSLSSRNNMNSLLRLFSQVPSTLNTGNQSNSVHLPPQLLPVNKKRKYRNDKQEQSSQLLSLSSSSSSSSPVLLPPPRPTTTASAVNKVELTSNPSLTYDRL